MNKAFLIGINSLGLQYAAQDVDLMSHALRQHDYKISIADHDKFKLLEQLTDFVDTAKSTDTLIIYFSGHGHLVKGKLHLVLGEQLQKQAHLLDIGEITKSLDFCKAKHKLIILDCCHAGIKTEEWSFDISESYRILTASERLEKAKEIDDLKASFLTYHIHDALTNHETKITNTENLGVSDLYRWLETQAHQYNAQHQTTVPIPNLLGNEKNNIPLLSLETTPQQKNKIRIQKVTEGLVTKLLSNELNEQFFNDFIGSKYLNKLEKNQSLLKEDEVFLTLLENFLNSSITAETLEKYWYNQIKPKQVKKASQLDYDNLGEQLNRGNTAVFIASNVQEALIEKLADSSEFQGDFPKACQFVEYQGRATLEDKIKDELFNLKHSPTYLQLCELLAQVQKNIVILSTCQDNQLEKTFEQQDKPYIVIAPHSDTAGKFLLTAYDSLDIEVRMNNEIACGQLLEKYSIIYKSMGCAHLRAANGSTLCLSETDYFQFAKEINELIPENLITQLQGKGLWFLGYYPKTWENRLLIQSLLDKCKSSRYPTKPMAIDSETTDFTELYWSQNNIQNHKIELAEFIRNLQQAM
ncbi:caspase family protein [Candidatus Albibeggiatoa sp. nov. NOAA]|uniref:caspase family protein n=1 Tax=Candidatus Albibeggiatoa sp. nov. NOAA TaxID=3162724 RepID=UPI0032F999AA|nr:caspase family protein [Thiotrichaceae bacterium]